MSLVGPGSEGSWEARTSGLGNGKATIKRLFQGAVKTLRPREGPQLIPSRSAGKGQSQGVNEGSPLGPVGAAC